MTAAPEVANAIDQALRCQITPVGKIEALSGPDEDGRFYVKGWVDFAAVAGAAIAAAAHSNQRKLK